MELIAGFFITFILILYTVTSFRKTRSMNLETLQEQEKELVRQIEHMTTELSKQREQYENNKINKTVNLSNAVTNTLDIYEQSNIRVPVDIIEQLAYMTFYDEKEVFDFIENQRNYWKLECTKKPYKR